VSQGLGGVREAARRDKRQKFTALLHHVTTGLLRDSYYALKRQAAPGVDGVTWRHYEEGVEERLKDLHDRIHRGAYRAQPSRRTYIAKEDGRQRPLGIAALEDKIVQQAVVTVLNQIHEEDFLGFSYGFRPGRSQHDALDALSVGLRRRKVDWVLDLDVRGFFDNVSHEWLVKFIEHRIADRRIIRLIQKWLKAGVAEEGEWKETRVGTPQGAVVSPLLANIYLHYVFDLWVSQWRRKQAHGDVIVVRYADDAVLGFESRKEAEAFLEQLRERMQKFGLELHPEKTRLIEFGRFAEENRRQEERVGPRPSIFWASRTLVGRLGRAAGSRLDGRRSRSGCAANCKRFGWSCAGGGMNGSPRPGRGCARWCRATSTIMRYRGTSWRSRRSAGRWRVRGWRRCGGAVNGIVFRGSASTRSWTAICLCRGFCIRNLARASTRNTQGRSRMR
jgi:group II intron reverse transcriptase/maturase